MISLHKKYYFTANYYKVENILFLYVTNEYHNIRTYLNKFKGIISPSNVY